MDERITWEGVARMECAAVRELILIDHEPIPETLFCFRCLAVEAVTRTARWEPRAR